MKKKQNLLRHPTDDYGGQVKIVFWGTSKFAENILESLLENDSFNVVAVVTQTDKPMGRKKEITPPLVKQIAEKNNITVLQPDKLDDDFENKLRELNADVSVIASYGKIISKSILDIPVHGSINVHGSLLPKYRGASPIQTAIVNGETKTGATLILMDAGMDTGNILKQKEVEIHEDDNYETLLEKLSKIGAEILDNTIPALVAKKIKTTPQNNTEATYTKILQSEDYEIDWNKSAEEIHNFVRGVYPGAYGIVNTGIENIRAKIQDTEIRNPKSEISNKLQIQNYKFKNGTLFGGEKRLFVVCGDDDVLEIKKIQVAGKNVMSGRDFLNGQRDIEHITWIT